MTSATSATSAISAISDSVIRLTGMVKWFNNKAGFGFITVCDGEHAGKDIFTHYSSIRVTNSQYKYLVQGEYVDFTLVNSELETHEYQAIDVCGVKGGAIMCETTRNVHQSTQTRYMSSREASSREPSSREPNTREPSSRVYHKQYVVAPRVARVPRVTKQQPDSEGFTKIVRRIPKNDPKNDPKNVTHKV